MKAPGITWTSTKVMGVVALVAAAIAVVIVLVRGKCSALMGIGCNVAVCMKCQRGVLVIIGTLVGLGKEMGGP